MGASKKNVHRHHQKTMLSSLLSAWGFSFLGAVPLLLLLAAIAYRSDDPRAGLSAYATLFVTVLALSAGFLSARSYGKSGPLMGLLSGLGISILLFGLGLALSGTGDAFSFRIIMLMLVPILGLLGGWFGSVRRVRRRRPR